MKSYQFTEASYDTLGGSVSDDMLLSRLWMANRLKDTKIPIKSCAVLGSWYGVLPYVLNKICDIHKIFAVDNEESCLNVSKKLNPNVIHLHKDCNNLSYKNVDCVLNPSVNNIVGTNWYNNIPDNKLVLLQTENIEVKNNCPHNLKTMKQLYPLKKYLYEGTLKSRDKDGKFKRFMVIGYK